MTEPHEEFGAAAPHTDAVFAQARRERNAALRSSMIEAGVLKPVEDELTQAPRADRPVLKIGQLLKWTDYEVYVVADLLRVARERATTRGEGSL